MTDSNDDESELRLIFNTYDRNGTGYLSIMEFVELARALNSKVTEEGIKKGFHHVDKNQDGRIGFDEFVEWWNSR